MALYDSDMQRVTRLMYVRSGTRTSAYGVPARAYAIRFAFGREFISAEEGFCSDEGASEFEHDVSFAAPEGQYAVEQITLHPVLNGNAKTNKVSAGRVFLGARVR